VAAQHTGRGPDLPDERRGDFLDSLPTVYDTGWKIVGRK
jgi:hypothetical protein